MRGDLPSLAHGAGAVGIVQRQDRRLGEYVSRAETRRVVWVALNLGRPPLERGGQHSAPVAVQGQAGCKMQRNAGNDPFRLLVLGLIDPLARGKHVVEQMTRLSPIGMSDPEQLFSVGDDRSVRIWDTATGKQRGTLEGHTGAVYAVAVSADGKRAATAGEDPAIRLWELPAP